MAHVAKWKFGEIDELTKLMTNNAVIAIADISGIPAPQLQQMRANIRGKAIVRCSKNTLIKLALEKAGKEATGIQALEENINGQSVLIATNMNPFKLFQQLKGTKTMAPAKGGETASSDIKVIAGETPFKPGPIVGELQQVGIPAAIQQGKVVINKDKVVVKAGETIPTPVAQMLTRLEIFPIELGMNLQAVYEDGSVYLPAVLDIDMDQFLGQLAMASQNAFNLAIHTAWATPETMSVLLQKAYMDSKALAREASILNKDTVNDILAKANMSMIAVASKLKDDAIDEALRKKMT